MSINNRRIAIVYTKDPECGISGMDIIRWYSMSRAMVKLKYNVDMVSVTGQNLRQIGENLRLVPIKMAAWTSYCAVKTCYQNTIEHVPDHNLIISRLARVVSPTYSSRDRLNHVEGYKYQEKISLKAKAIIVNDLINKRRWQRYFGKEKIVEIIPTGCPRIARSHDHRAISFNKPTALFMGSICYRRVIRMLNEMGRLLKKKGWELVVIGHNKTKYYYNKVYELDAESCVYLGPVPENRTTSYINACSVGIALAASHNVFENETSKLYYYLRYGMPIVAEDRISNLHLLDATKWGSKFEFGCPDKAVWQIINVDKRLDRARKDLVMDYMAQNHSWDLRAKRLDALISSILK